MILKEAVLFQEYFMFLTPLTENIDFLEYF